MKKYIITDKVNTKAILPENVLLKGAVAIAKINPIMPGVPIAGIIPVAAVIAAKAMHDKSITKITSEEELKKYKNCISKEWKNNVIYVEHPFRNCALIEASLYKDYIIREMVSDISNYIMDHWDLSKLVIGLVVSGKGNAKIKVPVKDIDADAQIQCDLHKDYLFHVCDTHPNDSKQEEYIWIRQFPDIRAAVEHGSGKMEVRKQITLDMDIGVGIGKAVVHTGAKKTFEFYISYER